MELLLLLSESLWLKGLREGRPLAVTEQHQDLKLTVLKRAKDEARSFQQTKREKLTMCPVIQGLGHIFL